MALTSGAETGAARSDQVESVSQVSGSVWIEQHNTTDDYPNAASPLPPEMQYTPVNTIVIIVYSNLLWISLLGNGIVFSTLVRRKKKSRVHILLINLCTADMITTLIEMPLKIAWKSTVQWMGGDTMCRILSCLRVFGLYLSALLIIAISLDRFLAIANPLSSVRRAGERTRIMIFLAWILSIACAAPQAVIWHVLSHPNHTWYQQCVTFGSFSSEYARKAYGLGIMMLTYGLPLLTTLICYLGIWANIINNPVQNGTLPPSTDGRSSATPSFRLNNTEKLTKAKKRTLKMTFLIVGIFVVCWTPYQIIHLWFFFDQSTAAHVDQLIQEILFIFGVSSCVMNPYVYGLYSMGIWRNVEFLTNIPCLKEKFPPKHGIYAGDHAGSRSIIGDDDTFGERSLTLKRSANSRPHLQQMGYQKSSPPSPERRSLHCSYSPPVDRIFDKDKILYL
ncbi:adipokinetic hormone/corazonin-related peptide receptor variant I-like [Paramacrobiotus metropolitanus]|uniref:adipokinetic hormone/corazonin-related peptide receptor variant I-like n=1 Tax=Paramacrobiotus metropolitanus TaxID=2943436 RepID=UPI0024457EFF|nr:adipokinetic hormone/corazonin-related peptide receptor variant I-like [Paramacrobiotus metropolitanus]